MNLSSNLIENSYNEVNFPHKLLLTYTHVSRLCKVFSNGSSANIKLLKTQIHQIGQPGGLPLMKNLLKPLTKSVLVPLALTAAADAAIHKNMLGPVTTTLIISNAEINYAKMV